MRLSPVGQEEALAAAVRRVQVLAVAVRRERTIAAGVRQGQALAAVRRGGELAKRRPAVKVAAWSTIPVSAYCMCALKSLPLEQTKSSGTHKSMVLAAYSGPTSTSG